jgi:hypothetical protein
MPFMESIFPRRKKVVVCESHHGHFDEETCRGRSSTSQNVGINPQPFRLVLMRDIARWKSLSFVAASKGAVIAGSSGVEQSDESR